MVRPALPGDIGLASAARLLYADWWKVYRYHGGVRSAWTCLKGVRTLRRAAPSPSDGGVQFVTFSVVPRLTSVWLAALETVFGAGQTRVIVGDCSGALPLHVSPSPSCQILPMLNQHHGEKLDLLLERVCQSQIVVVCDDDIFWLDRAPIEWAIGCLRGDEKLAAVGIVPKTKLSSVLRGKVAAPMGSLIVLRRELWRREGLSFRVRPPEPGDEKGWFYDTGEYAQVELVRRGYEIALGGAEQQQHLVAFEAMSSWALKLQKWGGHIDTAIGVRGRPEKALRMVATARGLAEIVRATGARVAADLVPPHLLDRAEAVCLRHLDAAGVATIQHQVRAQLARLRPLLLAADLGARLR